MKLIKLSLLLLVVSTLFVNSVYAEVLFKDDFETGKIDAAKWAAPAVWKAIANADGVAVLGKYVLDCLGGEEVLSVMTFPENYDYYADFKSVNGLSGFIFQAQDTNNLYMNQISVTGSAHTPNNIRWHSKVKAAYAADPKPFTDKVDRKQNVWYRVKFEVRGATFKAYLGDAGASAAKLALVGDWAPKDQFKSGKIGIRMSGTEHAMYDNITIATVGFDLSTTAVDSHGKLAQTWGSLKK